MQGGPDWCSLVPLGQGGPELLAWEIPHPQNRGLGSPEIWPTGLASLQEGFGWTNGMALMLLDRYGDRLTSGTQLTPQVPHCLLVALLPPLLLSFLP